ncbi:MAG: YihA family ribosome biogenesis GTP-binding protein [Nitrospirae bacterium]|nr:YihA family ribosome biogenesis GTP-binding protein [Nitrospirota bacterium]
MKVTRAEFVKGAVDERGWLRDGMAQVAFVGRSNVGKSSLINSLVGRKGLVKTSSTPGKTREVNFFRINGAFYFVDLPGYGYARTPGKVQAGWGPMIEGYLKDSPDLRLVIFLVDIRHEPGDNDMVMREWLARYGLPTVCVATKADKITRGNRMKHVKILADKLQVPMEGIVEYSAQTGEGKGILWDAILDAVA